ncbi:MAG: queuosine precursor transporter [Tatlockia sp.]|nr:queuosine precursor transporter [Tatlockia sp.]
MNNNIVQKKEINAYIFLTSLVICGLAGSLITAPKIVHFGINFPFSNIVFSILTYPIVDCICELWGKQIARQTIWVGLSCQVLITLIIQASIIAPYSSFWHLQSEYQLILSTGIKVVIASLMAFALSQILDIIVYQKLKEISKGKRLWLRSNLSTYAKLSIQSYLLILFFLIQTKKSIYYLAQS